MLHHDMQVQLDPNGGELDIVDNIALPRNISSLSFVLNRGLRIVSSSIPVKPNASQDPDVRQYLVDTQGAEKLQLHYRGAPVLSKSTGHGGMPRGVLDSDGVYLDGASAWYPLTDLPLDGFTLTARSSNHWPVLSAGRLVDDRDGYHWTSKVPQDDLYLLAGPYHRHERRHGKVDLAVWLLEDDAELAERYLTLSGQYIDHYSKLIAPYPFGKFAVVENPWQTGLGMPSFTLLGSRVLRLPFIPYTSLPHEILHNWLGNGIWVDYRKGNWSEGLTAYLADHWMKQRRGQGAQHRLKSLQRYTNFATSGRDAPLLQFVSRHDDTSQAIGYDKSMMLFHMLRNALGDKGFVEALRHLWQKHRFQAIGFAQALDTLLADRPDLLPRFLPWLSAARSPRLRLVDVHQTKGNNGYRLQIDVEQQTDRPLPLLLPVYVTTDADRPAQRSLHWIEGHRSSIAIDLPQPALRVDIDPAFEVPRYLADAEQPPALNQLFGGDAWLVIPTEAPTKMRAAWTQFAHHLQQRYAGLKLAGDSDALPADADRLLLGWDNRMLDGHRSRFTRDDQQLMTDGAIVAHQPQPAAKRTLVLVDQNDAGQVTGFVGAPDTDAIEALTRKLPHYGSYGRLVFDRAMKNIRHDTLNARHSPLSRTLAAHAVPLSLTPQPALEVGDSDAQ